MNRNRDGTALQSYTIDDDLAHADRGAIEVSVTLADGRSRWLFFMTPSALMACGDWVEGTQVRVHLGVPHMLVVGTVSADIIERVLKQLDASGELEHHTLPLGDA